MATNSHFWYSQQHYQSLKRDAAVFWGHEETKDFTPRGTCQFKDGRNDYYTLKATKKVIGNEYAETWKDARYIGEGKTVVPQETISGLHLKMGIF